MVNQSIRISRVVSCLGSTKGTISFSKQFASVIIRATPTNYKDTKAVILGAKTEVVTQDGMPYDHSDVELFLRGTNKGILDVIEHYNRFGILLTGFEISIEKLIVHPIDSTELSFRVAARNAMAGCLVSSDPYE